MGAGIVAGSWAVQEVARVCERRGSPRAHSLRHTPAHPLLSRAARRRARGWRTAESPFRPPTPSHLPARAVMAAPAPTTFWLVSLPATASPDATASALRAALADTGLASVARFALPDLRSGTLDALLALCDDLARVNAGVEGVVNKVRRQLHDLAAAGGGSGSAASVGGAPPSSYLARFAWDAAKYPPRAPLADTVAAIAARVARVDDDLKARAAEHAAARSALAASTRRQTGSLAVRDLAPVIAGRELVSSEHLVTLGAVVGRGADRDFTLSYETLADYVVPRSALLLAEDGDYKLYGVTLFRRAADAFRAAARARGFQVRDLEAAAPAPGAPAAAPDGGVAALRADLEAKRAALDAWCAAAYGDVFAAWAHVTAVRMFAESVLRYGVPPRMVAALVAPRPKAGAKARAALAALAGPAAGSKHFDGGDGGGEDMYPYVSFTLTIED